MKCFSRPKSGGIIIEFGVGRVAGMWQGACGRELVIRCSGDWGVGSFRLGSGINDAWFE